MENFIWNDDLVNDFMMDVFAPCDPRHPFIKDKMRQFKEKNILTEGFVVKDTFTDTFYYKQECGLWKRDTDSCMFTIHDNEIGPHSRYNLMPFGVHKYILDIPKKDWEIISFKHEWTGATTFFIKAENGLYSTEKYPDEFFVLDAFINNKIGKKYLIHSVKRLSDGEVFTVRDYIKSKVNDNNPFTIEKIQIINNDYIYLDSCPLDNAVKLKPKVPLFTTEDGVEIFEKEKFYFVHEDFAGAIENFANAGFFNKPGTKFFSTKEKADEYILQNKPIELTLKEVLSNWAVDYPLFKSLTEQLFKSKIKQ